MKNQVAHIFRKDVRQHWREIVLSVTIIVAYAWHEVTRSLTSAYALYDFPFLAQTLPLLVVVAWAFLILRTSHAECLVGDRQFWVTRPYEWKKLLAAKLLFVLVFVNVPLLILQIFLLLEAGFPITPYVPGLLWLQLLWFLVLICPVATLATVTASIGQFVLGILGVLLYIFAVVSLSSLVPAAGVSRAGGFVAALDGVVLGATSVAVVLWQFARRRTGRSRILLLAAAAAVPIIMFATPYRTLIAHFYPQATPGQQLPVQLAFDPAKLASHEGGYPEKNKVHVRIPLLVSGVGNGSMIHVDGTIESIQANGGLKWNSAWHASGVAFLANRQHAQVDITVDKDFFEKVKSSPVNVYISFALAPAQARETLRIVAQAGQFAVPGDGRCSFSPNASNDIVCLFPPNFFPLSLVTARSDEITCTPREHETPPPAGTIGYGWITGAGFGISSVHLEALRLWDWGEVKTRDFLGRVCPGTPLTMFTNWKDLQRTRSELEIDGIRLGDYRLNDAPGGEAGFGINLP